MDYGYYPGCSLTGSARKLDKGVRQIFRKLGHRLTEIPDWNCCGALEYGDRKSLCAFQREPEEGGRHVQGNRGALSRHATRTLKTPIRIIGSPY